MNDHTNGLTADQLQTAFDAVVHDIGIRNGIITPEDERTDVSFYEVKDILRTRFEHADVDRVMKTLYTFRNWTPDAEQVSPGKLSVAFKAAIRNAKTPEHGLVC